MIIIMIMIIIIIIIMIIFIWDNPISVMTLVTIGVL